MHNPTQEQDIIITRGLEGHKLLVEALSGTGKTTTNVMLANAMGNRRGTYLTFNKSIAEDAGRKFTGNNVLSSTVHSRAYQAVGIQYSGRLEGPAGGTLSPLRILQYFNYSGQGGISPMSRAGLARRTLSNFLSTMADEPGPEHIPHKDMLQLANLRSYQQSDVAALQELFAEDARQLWQEIVTPSFQGKGELPMPHDGYLHLYAKSNPRLPGDFIMLDEAQDASEVIKHIVLSQDAQPIIVGDQRQSIYGWRGAVNLMEELDWEKSYLTQSFRFGDRIAGAANNVLDHLECPVRLRGFEVDRSNLPMTRAMMFRTNAGVFRELIHRTLEKDQRIHIAGGVSDLYSMLSAVEALKRGRATPHPDFVGFTSWPEYEEASEEYNAPHEMRLLVKIVNKYPMERLKNSLSSAKGVEEQGSYMTLLTSHKGKGREWRQVAIGDDFTLPNTNPLLDTEETRLPLEEARLQYVALTRAQENIFGANAMIAAYRDRAKVKAEIDSVKDQSAEVRLQTKMKYAPHHRNEEDCNAFVENLQPDEWALLTEKLDQKLTAKYGDKAHKLTPEESAMLSVKLNQKLSANNEKNADHASETHSPDQASLLL